MEGWKDWQDEETASQCGVTRLLKTLKSPEHREDKWDTKAQI
jgi:hypothetical protein